RRSGPAAPPQGRRRARERGRRRADDAGPLPPAPPRRPPAPRDELTARPTAAPPRRSRGEHRNAESAIPTGHERPAANPRAHRAPKERAPAPRGPEKSDQYRATLHEGAPAPAASKEGAPHPRRRRRARHTRATPK